jgi:hypothetical protein
MKKSMEIFAAVAAMLSLTGAAQAFEGRNAAGAIDTTCTASGTGKCAMFFDARQGITILNNWNIGAGIWDAAAGAGSAQALAASAGLGVSGLTGWVLPSVDEIRSIWNDSEFGHIQYYFDGYSPNAYWTSTPDGPGQANFFGTYNGLNYGVPTSGVLYTVAVRSGDIAAAVPEPQTYAMLALGLAGVLVAVRRRRI